MSDAQPEQSPAVKADDVSGIDAYLTSRHVETDLKGRTVRSGLVSMVAQAIRLPVTLASLAILGRRLSPDDYGLLNTVTVITSFVFMFQDVGLTIATIQSPKITHRQVSNLFWLNLAVGVLLCAILVLVSPVIAWFYGEPRARDVACALSIVLLLAGGSLQHQALLRRQMRFAVLAVIDVTALVGGTVCAIVLAFRGAGYWSLVAMQLTTSGVSAVGVWLASRWIPALPARGAGVRPLLRYAGNLSGFQIVDYVMRNLDNLLVGRVWGTVALGFYGRAYNLFMLPLTMVITPVAYVMIPSLSRLQDQPQRFRNYYLQTVSAIHLLTMPAAVIMILFPTELAVLVLGPQWHASGPILQILGVSAIFQPAYYCCGWLYMSLGRTRQYLRLGIAVAAVTCTGFFVGISFGARGVATAYTVALLLVIGPCVRHATRDTPITARQFCRALLPHLLAALVAVATGFALRYLPSQEPAPVYRFAAAAGAFALAELALFKQWSPPLVAAAWEIVRARRPA